MWSDVYFGTTKASPKLRAALMSRLKQLSLRLHALMDRIVKYHGPQLMMSPPPSVTPSKRGADALNDDEEYARADTPLPPSEDDGDEAGPSSPPKRRRQIRSDNEEAHKWFANLPIVGTGQALFAADGSDDGRAAVRAAPLFGDAPLFDDAPMLGDAPVFEDEDVIQTSAARPPRTECEYAIEDEEMEVITLTRTVSRRHFEPAARQEFIPYAESSSAAQKRAQERDKLKEAVRPDVGQSPFGAVQPDLEETSAPESKGKGKEVVRPDVPWREERDKEEKAVSPDPEETSAPEKKDKGKEVVRPEIGQSPSSEKKDKGKEVRRPNLEPTAASQRKNTRKKVVRFFLAKKGRGGRIIRPGSQESRAPQRKDKGKEVVRPSELPESKESREEAKSPSPELSDILSHPFGDFLQTPFKDTFAGHLETYLNDLDSVSRRLLFDSSQYGRKGRLTPFFNLIAIRLTKDMMDLKKAHTHLKIMIEATQSYQAARATRRNKAIRQDPGAITMLSEGLGSPLVEAISVDEEWPEDDSWGTGEASKATRRILVAARLASTPYPRPPPAEKVW